jgi:formylglycine-generating enzyme required for sulfatase activity
MNLIPEGKLIEDSLGRTIEFKSFWLSNQITNKEYREFWDYAKSNPDKELEWIDMSKINDITIKPQSRIKKIKYSEVVKISFNQENWPSDNYFESKEYNNSPVIGVPKELANYYCIWKTTKTFDSLNEDEMKSASSYYLPTTSQINYAQKIQPSLFAEKEVGFRITIDK